MAGSGEEFVENHSQRVDIVRVSMSANAGVRLLGAHVARRAYHSANARHVGFIGDACETAFAIPKSMMRGKGLPSISTTSTFEGFRSRWMMAF